MAGRGVLQSSLRAFCTSCFFETVPHIHIHTHQVNALNTIWELRLDKPYKNGGSEHSERVGMVGEGNLPNLHTAVTVEGSLNDAAVDDVGWGVVAKIPFADLTAAGHCLSAPAPLDSWSLSESLSRSLFLFTTLSN